MHSGVASWTSKSLLHAMRALSVLTLCRLSRSAETFEYALNMFVFELEVRNIAQCYARLQGLLHANNAIHSIPCLLTWLALELLGLVRWLSQGSASYGKRQILGDQ